MYYSLSDEKAQEFAVLTFEADDPPNLEIKNDELDEIFRKYWDVEDLILPHYTSEFPDFSSTDSLGELISSFGAPESELHEALIRLLK